APPNIVLGKIGIKPRESPCIGLVDEQTIYLVQKVITSGAVNGPVFGNRLLRTQDFFRDHVKWPLTVRRCWCPVIGKALAERSANPAPIQTVKSRITIANSPGTRQHVMLLQSKKILGRVVEPIGMINAEAAYLAIHDKIENQTVRCLEYFLALHVQGSQVVDVKESPVIDLIGRHAPVGQAIALVL